MGPKSEQKNIIERENSSLLKCKKNENCVVFVPQCQEFGCQTPAWPSLTIENFRPDNEQY